MPRLHYRARKTKDREEGGPLCAAFDGKTPDGHRVLKTWKELQKDGVYLVNACPECIGVRNAPKSQAPAAAAPEPLDLDGLKGDWTQVASALLHAKLYRNQRAPLPEAGAAALEATMHSAVDVADHYGLLGAASHPLVPLVVNGFILVQALRALPVVEDVGELNRLYGLPEGHGDPQPDPAQSPLSGDSATGTGE